MQSRGVIQVCQFDSPLGKIAVAERREKIISVGFRGLRGLREEHPEIWQWDRVNVGTEGAGAQALRLYLAGERAWSRLSVDLGLVRGAFDRAVLQRLHKLRAGQTVTYGELAQMAGRPRAARAVGGAMRRNPIPILIPCHRVLPSVGGVGHYTGGVEKKIWLLAHEGIRL